MLQFKEEPDQSYGFLTLHSIKRPKNHKTIRELDQTYDMNDLHSAACSITLTLIVGPSDLYRDRNCFTSRFTLIVPRPIPDSRFPIPYSLIDFAYQC